MKEVTTYKYCALRFIYLIIVTSMLGNVGYAQTITNKTIIHKKGETQLNNSVYDHPEQKTATQQSVVYAIPGGDGRVIKLPPGRNGGASPTSNYARWYDYTTDGYPTGFNFNSSYNYSCGAVMINKDVQNAVIGLNASEKERIIACDVSSYKDYKNESSTLTEPTLSYRSIFYIRDAHIIADRLKECIGEKFLEEKNIYMPAAPKQGKENPKVTLDFDLENYFGYCYNSLVNKESDPFNYFTEWEDVNPTTQQRRELTISPTITFTTENTGSTTVQNRFCTIIPQNTGTKIQAKVFWNCFFAITGRVEERKKQGDGWGKPKTIGYDSQRTESIKYNLARFNIEFVDKPAQYVMPEKNERSIKYMDENYVLLAKEDFDYDTNEATTINNCYTKALDNCSYGFVYSQLYNQRYWSNYVAQWNEYGFYKTAQVTNISKNGTNHYQWYNNGNPVYDRRYYNNKYQTGKTDQNGYFMYIDASNMPGVVAKLKFETPLCAGTKLFVSAGICNLVEGSSTDGDVNFIFKGVTKDGKEVELNRYTSGNIPKVQNNTNAYGGENGKEWYQAYYTFTIESEIEFDYYLVQVENNASDTAGGDYAVDDIRVYRSKPGTEAVQTELPCGEEIPKVKISIEFDKLIAGLPNGTIGNQTLRYRFLDENRNILDYDYRNDKDYGEILYSTNFNDHSTGEPPVAAGDVLAGRETSSSGTKFLVFHTPNNQSLMPRKYYYVAIANAEGKFDEGICGLVSLKFRIEPASYITVDGVPDIDTSGLCFGLPMEIGAALKDRITMELLPEGYRFDWYLGTSEEFTNVYDALQQYRLKDPKPAEGNTNLKDVTFDEQYTKEMYLLLQKEVEAGRLRLNVTKLQLLIQKDADIRAVVIPGTISIENAEVCKDVIIFSTSKPGKTPLIVLGTQYGESITSTIRMSKSQFDELVNGKKLEIPIWDYKDSNGNQTKTLRPIENDNDIILTGTSDKYETDLSVKVGKLTSITQSKNSLLVTVAPSSGFVAHEGYYYRMLFYFEEEKGGDEVCHGSVEFNIKIVPEHLTWTGEFNDNWNNDANWKRSTGDELYNTDYTDDTKSKGYVPLEFSKVTIANNATAPWLYKVEGAKGTCIQNLDNTNTAESKATEYLESDMVAQFKNSSTYNCINFYANTCEQVYFKPQAEMRNTYCLNYNKAWADFELTSGRWYMLAAPLQGTVAGDMYLPTNGGRQETTAFRDITFSTDKNNRFNPAVYQRNWDHANSTIIKRDGTTEDAFVNVNWSNVYNKVDEKYESGKGFSIRPCYGTNGTDKVLFRLPKADNSYSYYTYSINGTENFGNNTPITRENAGKLNDATNENGEIIVNLTNTSNNSNYFLIGNPYMATLDMRKFFEENSGFEKKFWVMTEDGQNATILNEDGTFTTSDQNANMTIAPMQSFFVEKKAQTRSTASGNIIFQPSMTIAKPQNRSSLNAVTRAVSSEAENKYLYISAEREGKHSNILIEQRYNATNEFNENEDVEALIDSNLGDSPILYSIAGNRAATINITANQKLIPLGIHSSNNEEVTLTFNGLENFDDQPQLYDAQLNTSIQLSNETAISIPGNTHGRYFLAMNSLDNNDQTNNINIYSPEKNKIIVATSPSDKLQRIYIYSINGMLIKESGNLNSISEEFNLPTGLYIIHAESLKTNTTGKVNCMN